MAPLFSPSQLGGSNEGRRAAFMHGTEAIVGQPCQREACCTHTEAVGFGYMPPFSALRNAMVEGQIVSRGVRSPLVLEAMRTVPREAFLPKSLQQFAYDDSPLPIGASQTISQPYIVAFMVEALNLTGGETVLEIGAGSGYAAAVLSRIAGRVYTVERIGQLAEKAAAVLADLHYENVLVRLGDGTKGWAEFAPYDAIIVAAGGPEVPHSLKCQLKPGGRLVIPVGNYNRTQELVRVTRLPDDTFKTEEIAKVQFVPLIGKEGWLAGGSSSRSKMPYSEYRR